MENDGVANMCRCAVCFSLNTHFVGLSGLSLDLSLDPIIAQDTGK
jgi:hypothetical protein